MYNIDIEKGEEGNELREWMEMKKWKEKRLK